MVEDRVAARQITRRRSTRLQSGGYPGTAQTRVRLTTAGRAHSKRANRPAGMAILGLCLWALNITHDIVFLTDQSSHCCFERSQKETIRKRTGQELSARKRNYTSYNTELTPNRRSPVAFFSRKSSLNWPCIFHPPPPPPSGAVQVLRITCWAWSFIPVAPTRHGVRSIVQDIRPAGQGGVTEAGAAPLGTGRQPSRPDLERPVAHRPGRSPFPAARRPANQWPMPHSAQPVGVDQSDKQ